MYPSPIPPPPAGFKRAIDSGLDESRSYPIPMEQRGGSNNGGVSSCHIGSGGTHTYSPVQYPTAVLWGKLIEVISTSTIVTTASSTVTSYAVQSTITNIASTVTSTFTAIVIPPQATFYAACSPQNILILPPGFTIGGENFSLINYVNVIDPFAGTMYDYCVFCIQDPNCKAAEFEAGADTTCVLDYGPYTGSCAGGLTVTIQIGHDPGYGFGQS